MILSYIHWNIDPEIVNIFGVSVRYYGVLFVSGLLLSLYTLTWIFKNEHIPFKYLEKLSSYAIIGIFLGARLGHCLFYEPAYYLSNPLEMFLPISISPMGNVSFVGYRGLASHGGAIGLIIAIILYSRKTYQPIIYSIDLIAIVAPLGGAFIRFANLMNSEIIGIQTTQPWGFVFERVDNIPRHPAQLYEALSYLAIFISLIILYKTKRYYLKEGFFLGLSLILIFSARFVIEFIKEKQVAFENSMTLDMGQLLSIPFILIGIGFIIYSMRNSSNQYFLKEHKKYEL